MKTFLNLKMTVSSPAELRAVVCKLVSLGYGIGSNRQSRVQDSTYDHVFVYDDGMILFGRNEVSWGQKGTGFDRSKSLAVSVAEFLA